MYFLDAYNERRKDARDQYRLKADGNVLRKSPRECFAV